MDPYWRTDNRWIEIDTNTQFDNQGINDDVHSRFIVRVTAYPLGNGAATSATARTVQAEISAGHLVATGGGYTQEVTGAFTNAIWSEGTALLNSGPTIMAASTVRAPSTCLQEER